MRLQSNSGGEIISNGITETTTFKIAANGKAFSVLSSMLYQDKIGSIVREICSNAMDSHAAAGTPELPFEVHLPTHLEPWFSVRDFGVGLSHEDIHGIYTTLFASSKEQSDNQVGAFGLGSKTPFAYSDSFAVTSIFNGMKHNYAAMLKPNGEPTINLLGEAETDEHNGVEVHIIVKDKDYGNFENKVRDQLRFFKTKPVIVNNTSFKFEDMEENIFYRLKGFNVLKENAGGRTYIIQGGVGYPLEYATMREYFATNPAMLAFVAAIEPRGAHITFDIGTIEVTASREGIQYTQFTTENIAKRFMEARDEFTGRAEADLDQLLTDWDRGVTLNEGGVLYRSAIQNKNKYSFQWQGHKYGYVIAEQAIVPSNGVDADGKALPPTRLFDFRKLSLRGSTKIGETTSSSLAIYCTKNVHIIIEDKCKNLSGRIRMDAMEAFESERDVQYFVITPPLEYNVARDRLEHVEVSDQCIADISAKFGGVKIVRASSLKEPVRIYQNADGTTSSRSGYRPPKLYQYEGNGEMSSRRSYTQVYDKIKSIVGGAYIVIPNGERSVLVNFDQHLLRALMTHKLIDIGTIYAIRERDVKRVEQSNTWVPVAVALDNCVAKLKADKVLTRRLAYRKAMVGLDSVSNLVREVVSVAEAPLLKKYYNRFYKNRRNLNDTDSFIANTILNEQNSDYSKLYTTYLGAFKATVTKLHNKYPLLFGLDRAWNSKIDSSTIQKGFLEYVSAIG